MRPQTYFVYILTDQRHTVLYIGITNGLEQRLSQHMIAGRIHFARQYNAEKLIYFETFSNPRSAIAREKQLKGWRRSKKEALIAVVNPEWRDLMSEMMGIE